MIDNISDFIFVGTRVAIIAPVIAFFVLLALIDISLGYYEFDPVYIHR